MDLPSFVLVLRSHNKVCVARVHVQMKDEEALVCHLKSILHWVSEGHIVRLVKAIELEEVDHEDHLDGGVIHHVFKEAHDGIEPPLEDVN